MNKKTAVIICLIAGIGVLIKFLPQSRSISEYSRTGASKNLSEMYNRAEEDGYRISFPLENSPRGMINCYMLKYRPNIYDTAKKYAGLFIDIETFSEDERAYIFSGEQGSMLIDKEINQIHFEAALTEDKDVLLNSDEQAIKIAADFIENHSLILIYEESQVRYDGYTYRVMFINRIGNLKNYAFSNKVTMDNYGRILTMDYYTTLYDKVGECRIKAMEEAFYELPALKDDETVLLLSCQLVYIYDDSIIQPAYYFQGSANDEKTFEGFVKAAVF